MDRDAVYGRVVWILNNHELEESLLRDQLERERLALNDDLERIYGIVGIKAIDYSADRVQASVKDESRVATVIAMADERRAEYEERAGDIRLELEVIASIYKLVSYLEGMDRAVLLALYYPKRTYGAAAKMLGYSVQSLTRYRSRAIERLVDSIMAES